MVLSVFAPLLRSTALVGSLTAVAAFSSVPKDMDPSMEPTVTVVGLTTDCDGSQCFNRLHPSIPMAAYAEPGEVILFDTPQATSDFKDTTKGDENLGFDTNTVHIGTLHQLAGPVGISGAVAGDKIAITILDIEAKTWGWNHAAPNLGFLSDMVQAGKFNWWQPKGDNPAKPDAWVSEMFPDVEVPFNPFPGIVTVLPDMDIVQRVKEREIVVSAAGGTAQRAGSLTMGLTGDMPSAFPSSICGEEGTDPDNCLRTIAPDVYYGNEDSQRITVGNTLVVECFVDGCGIGIGDVHGAQGDGEVSITAIEIEALVKVKVKLIKPDDPMYPLPSPTTLGAAMNPLHASPFVSFHGFGDKPRQRGLFRLSRHISVFYALEVMVVALPLVNISFGPLSSLILDPDDVPACEVLNARYHTGKVCLMINVELLSGYVVLCAAALVYMMTGWDQSTTHKFMEGILFCPAGGLLEQTGRRQSRSASCGGRKCCVRPYLVV